MYHTVTPRQAYDLAWDYHDTTPRESESFDSLAGMTF